MSNKLLAGKRYSAGNLNYSLSSMLIAMTLILIGVFTYAVAVSFVPRISRSNHTK